MKLLSVSKDGGKDSLVWACWLIEIKFLFSIAILVFKDGSRDAYHSHAFNCISWLLRGCLIERHLSSGHIEVYKPSLWPVVTRRETFHKVESIGVSIALTFRGPWAKRWSEYLPKQGRYAFLTHGRKEVASYGDRLP